ncbi:hypothetical protein BJ138DRAFT_1019890 [Hygrophoropsis aurantiaca]|uniref:Uncharacterized protein n=1 Tax=Hygrophoropsis aurantiaca TaxID=72124 RepID=A0ACB7ZS51_9AGAM|nr:hypothetical protein BJ138DRAFT_1019890 [Hygrophoropsis aurantiaca]
MSSLIPNAGQLQVSSESGVSRTNFLKFIHPQFEIPAEAQKILLPTASLSVLEYIQFSLPIISNTPLVHPPSAFFSQYDPTSMDLNIIAKIPVPPAATVNELEKACQTAVHAGAKSVLCPHSVVANNMCLPLWVLPYWTEVLDLRTSSQDRWVKAEESLRQRNNVWKKSNPTSCMLIQEVYDALASFPWSGNIRGFDNEEPVHHLAAYATHRSWLSDVHENQMLDMLRRDLALSPNGSRIVVENLQFMKTLQMAYANRDNGTYTSSRYFSRIRGTGEALSSVRRTNHPRSLD